MHHCRHRIAILVLIALTTFYAQSVKGSHTGTDISTSLDQLTGVWASEGYGHIVEIEGGSPAQFRRYEINDSSCLLIDSGNVENFYRDFTQVLRNDDSTRFTHMLSGNVTTYAYNRLAQLPPPCRNGGTADSSDPLLNFDVLWSTFNEQYAFFEQRGVNWTALRQQFRGQLDGGSSDQELFDVLVRLMTPLCDGHVELTSPFGDFNGEINPDCWGEFLPHILSEFEGQTQYDDPFEFFQQVFTSDVLSNIEDHYLVGNLNQAARGKILWGDLGGGIAYLSILQMTNYANEEATEDEDLEVLALVLDEVMTSLSNKDAMVIDLRLNTGGYDHVALDIASRFAAQPRVAFTKKARWGDGFTAKSTHVAFHEGALKFTRPIVILTSDLTASAAENFLLAMESLPQVTIIGETTVGVHSDVLERRLPNGWTFTLSNEVNEAPDGTLLEARGIEPDIEITAPRAEDMAVGRDYGIEAALTHLSAHQMGPGLNDAWYDPATQGQGFFITVFPSHNLVWLAWFTYDTELPPPDAQAMLGDPGHRWLTALGTIDNNSSVMEIELTSGGIFDTPTDVQRTQPPGSDGTITLTFNDCKTGTVEYDIPSVGGQGTIPIQRVAGDNIELCKALNGLPD